MLNLLECYMLDKQILFLLFDFFLKYLLNIFHKMYDHMIKAFFYINIIILFINLPWDSIFGIPF